MSTEKVKVFAERLKLRLGEMRIGKAEIARQVGVSPSTITTYLASRNFPSRDVAADLAKELNCDERWLLGEDVAENVKESDGVFTRMRKIPVVSWTTAGEMTSYEDLANQIDEFADSTTKDPNAFAIEVVGDSMEGEIHPGDWVILEPNREASSGDMAYVRLTDEAGGGGTLKWFKRTGPEGRVIRLVPENPEWPTTEHPIETIKFAYPVGNVHRRRPRKKL